MTLYVLECTLAEDYEERRVEHRPEHLRLLREAADAGTLVLAGPLTEPFDRSLLVWTDAGAAEEFMAKDPYARHGVTLGSVLRSWSVAAGTAS